MPTASRPTPRLGRRALLGGLALGGLAASGGCAGLTERVSSTSRGSRDRLTVQVYGTDTEADLYQRLARRFEDENPGTTVDVTYVPFAEALTAVDSGLLAGTAPDVFRVDYPTMGLYSGTGQLLDLTDAADDLAADVRPAFMGAVSFGERVFGVPQHVDTSALLYRPDAFEAAGLGPVPDRPEDAWSWEEFGRVADTLRDAGPERTAPFAVNWQEFGAFRWLTWLYAAGGQLYDEDLTAAALDDEAGTRALDFTRSFFDRGWVPAATSTKATTLPDALFTSGRLSMVFAGNFLLPAFAETIGDRFGYAVTYQPRDARRASELGGNALVANRDATNPDLATAYLLFMADARQMADFCAEAVLLPTRDSVLATGLDFALGADLMPVYADQITTITDRDVADVTTPTFAEVNTALGNELEQCFLGGASVSDTLGAVAEQVDATAALNETGGVA
ncbi:sugar ABC transporter substrate-binding protein [Nocardioides lentus]|uniref:Sugar ABC transporter substrate-binding protein n=1 Tax=Nocardioides lentus TaxID=338077 RepID=A0ABN2P231_9ACTN